MPPTQSKLLPAECDPPPVTAAIRTRELADINMSPASSPAETTCRSVASDLTLIAHGLEDALLKLKELKPDGLDGEKAAIALTLREEILRLQAAKKDVIISLKFGFSVTSKIKTPTNGLDADTLKKIQSALKEKEERSPPRKRPGIAAAKNQFPCHSCGLTGHWRGDPACPAAFSKPSTQGPPLYRDLKADPSYQQQQPQPSSSYQYPSQYDSQQSNYISRLPTSFPSLTYQKK